MHVNGPPNISTLPPPAQWATYIWGRTPNFKQHGTLGQAKNALGYSTGGRNGNFYHEGYLYENVDGVWTLRHSVDRSQSKATHPLWTQPTKKGRPVSDKAVAKAIESILGKP